MGGALASMGKFKLGVIAASVAVVALGVKMGVAAVKSAAAFEQAMARVKAISGAVGKDFAALETKAKELGKTTKFTMVEIASGMEVLARAGLDTNEIIASMAGVTALASSQAITLAEAGRMTAAAIRGMGLAIADTERVVNLFAATASSAALDVNDLSESFKLIAPIADILGISIEQVAAMIAAVGNVGITGSQATATLRKAFLGLADPVAEAQEWLNRLNIEVWDAQGNFIGLGKMIGLLEESFKNLTTQQKLAAIGTIFNTRSSVQLLALIKQGEEGFNKYVDSITNTIKAYEQQKIMLDTLSSRWTILQSSVDLLMLTLGTPSLDTLSNLTTGMTDVVNTITEWKEETQAVADELKEMGDEAEGAEKKIVSLSDRILDLTGGLANLKGVVYGVMNAIKLIWDATFGVLVVAIKTVMYWLVSVIKLLQGDWKGVWEAQKQMYQSLGSYFAKIFSDMGIAFKDFIDDVTDWWSGMWLGLKRDMTSFVNFFIARINNIISLLNKIPFVGMEKMELLVLPTPTPEPGVSPVTSIPAQIKAALEALRAAAEAAKAAKETADAAEGAVGIITATSTLLEEALENLAISMSAEGIYKGLKALATTYPDSIDEIVARGRSLVEGMRTRATSLRALAGENRDMIASAIALEEEADILADRLKLAGDGALSFSERLGMIQLPTLAVDLPNLMSIITGGLQTALTTGTLLDLTGVLSQMTAVDSALASLRNQLERIVTGRFDEDIKDSAVALLNALGGLTVGFGETFKELEAQRTLKDIEFITDILSDWALQISYGSRTMEDWRATLKEITVTTDAYEHRIIGLYQAMQERLRYEEIMRAALKAEGLSIVEVDERLRRLRDALEEGTAAAMKLSDLWSPLANVFGELTWVLEGHAKAAASLAVAFLEGLPSITDATSAIVFVVNMFSAWIRQTISDLEEKIKGFEEQIRGLEEQIQELRKTSEFYVSTVERVVGVMNSLLSVLGPLGSIFGATATAFTSAIKMLTLEGIDLLNAGINMLANYLNSLISTVIGLIQKSDAYQAVQEQGSRAWKAISDLFGQFLWPLAALLKHIMDWLGIQEKVTETAAAAVEIGVPSAWKRARRAYEAAAPGMPFEEPTPGGIEIPAWATAIVEGIAGAIEGVLESFGISSWTDLLEKFKAGSIKFWTYVQTKIPELVASLTSIFNTISDALGDDPVGAITDWLKKTFDWFIHKLPAAVVKFIWWTEQIWDLIGFVWKWFQDQDWEQIWEDIKDKFAEFKTTLEDLIDFTGIETEIGKITTEIGKVTTAIESAEAEIESLKNTMKFVIAIAAGAIIGGFVAALAASRPLLSWAILGAATVGALVGGGLAGIIAGAFQEGGIIPGPIGRPQLIIGEGGERVQTIAQQRQATNVFTEVRVYLGQEEVTDFVVNRVQHRSKLATGKKHTAAGLTGRYA